MMRIYLIRHGQSIYQSLKIVSGMNEFGLSGLGKVQSKKIGQILSGIRFDHVYSSDFKRCIETYELIEKELKHKPQSITFTPVLRERDPGDDLLKSYAEVYPIQQPTITRESNAETSEQIQTRAKKFFHLLITNQLYKRSFKYASIEALNKMLLGSQIPDNPNYHHFLRPYLQAQQFSTSQKDNAIQNILVMSHAGFITEAVQYLYQKQGVVISEGLQPNFYARNGALFLAEIDAEDNENWKCQVHLRNYSKKISTPFEHML